MLTMVGRSRGNSFFLFASLYVLLLYVEYIIYTMTKKAGEQGENSWVLSHPWRVGSV